jgi:hypothetical protein
MTEQRCRLRYLTWQRMSHNPEVAGSNPAPDTRKALETGPFCCQLRDRGEKLLPNFCPECWSWESDLAEIAAFASLRRYEREAQFVAW